MPTSGRTVSSAALLVIEAALALLAVLVHQGFMAVYGEVTDTACGLAWGLTAGAIPVLMLLGTLTVTPLALARPGGNSLPVRSA